MPICPHSHHRVFHPVLWVTYYHAIIFIGVSLVFTNDFYHLILYLLTFFSLSCIACSYLMPSLFFPLDVNDLFFKILGVNPP